ncbi:hypothetical protein BDZ91DRAFT_745871 [Kalaharituber pfeilii]|nr:hypothetical protein BDZ91DRAFT_745871 [Kalaharituber pfeilii]
MNQRANIFGSLILYKYISFFSPSIYYPNPKNSIYHDEPCCIYGQAKAEAENNILGTRTVGSKK